MIRIFVGCSANGEDAEAQAMLEYSLRHHASEDIELHWMMLSKDPASPWYSNPAKHQGWDTTGWATPFSAFRWAVPHVCKFKGRAIYMDVDMIARADIAELWNQYIPNLLTKDEKHSCVILFDCERVKPLLPAFNELQRTMGLYRDIRKRIGSHAGKFAGNWNCLDGENYSSLDHPDIKVIHFTRVDTQPHLKYALPRLRAAGLQHWNRQAYGVPHPRADVAPLVDRLWQDAQQAGYTADRYLPQHPFGNYNAVRGGARAA